jgi:hypothetical protein
MSITFAALACVSLIIGIAWIISIVDGELREDRRAYLATMTERERIALRDRNRNGQPSLVAHSAAASRQPIQYPKSLNDGDIAGRSQANVLPMRRLRGTDEHGRDGR